MNHLLLLELLLCQLISTGGISAENTDGNKTLRILAIVPMSGNSYPGGWPCLLPIKMAVEQINKRQDLLPEYNFTFDYIDDEGVPGRAVYKLTEALHSGKPYAMVMGPVQSPIAMATAEVSYNWNITQIAFAASSPVLSDRTRFKRFYRHSSPDRNQNTARIGVMKKFGWKKVASIHHAAEFFSTVMGDFVDAAMTENITITTQEVFLNDPSFQVENLKRQDARIIMTAMYGETARQVLCKAYKIGFYGPKIVWFFFGYLPTYFWQDYNENVGCTVSEMKAAVDGAFMIMEVNGNLEQERGIANLTYDEFMSQYKDESEYRPEMASFNHISDNSFDITWMSALALNCTDTRLKSMGHRKMLDQFDYSDVVIGDIMFECMGNTTLVGVSKKLEFPKGGDPITPVIIQRVQDGERYTIGYNRKDIRPDYFTWFDWNLRWRGGLIPRDSTVVAELEINIPDSLYFAFVIASSVGISLAAFFLVFNIAWKNNRFVKMSSPNINNVLLVGCIMCYSTVFFKPIGVESAVCQVRLFCFCLGFTISFGAMFSKTWRVYRIFTNKKLIRMSMKDYHLLAVNGLLALVFLLVLIVWQVLGPHVTTRLVLVKEIYYVGNDEEIRPFVRICQSSYSAYFGWVIYIMEGSLLAFGAFLAWETRKVTIPALNDSHQIGMCLYNVVILSAVGLTLSLLLEDQQVLLYGVTSGCLVIGTTLTQMIVFVPKVSAVYYKVEAYETDTMVSKAGPTSQWSKPRQPTNTASTSVPGVITSTSIPGTHTGKTSVPGVNTGTSIPGTYTGKTIAPGTFTNGTSVSGTFTASTCVPDTYHDQNLRQED